MSLTYIVIPDIINNNLNVIGVFTSDVLRLGTLINLSAVDGNPDRFGFLSPIIPSAVIGEVSLPTVIPPYQITLLYQSDSNLDNIIVYEDGIPIPHDSLTLIDASTVQLTSIDTTKLYT